MVNGPLRDAALIFEYLSEHLPEMDKLCQFAKLEITFKDGVVYSIGPTPYLIRGKDFHVKNGNLTRNST